MSESIGDPIELTIQEDDLQNFKRLDQYLSDKLDQSSRTYIKKVFEKDLIKSESPLSLKKMPPVGTIISVNLPAPVPIDTEPENIPLEILFEDEYLVIVNKPAGMVTHPAPGNYTGTLVNAILHHCPDLKNIGDKIRPGIVHRLDKGTSGVMVVAKEGKAHEGLVNLFSTHDISRIYECIAVSKKIPVGGTLESTIGRHQNNRLKMAINVPKGKKAITHYKMLEQFFHCAHLQMKLETGRTHQIRVHLSSILKAPILCDPAYANPKSQLNMLDNNIQNIIGNYPHPFLHARHLGFIHPITKKELSFDQEAPEIFTKTLEGLREYDKA